MACVNVFSLVAISIIIVRTNESYSQNTDYGVFTERDNFDKDRVVKNTAKSMAG